MFKLIVNTPEGIQQVIQIEKSGGYFDDTRVVWDERKDGTASDVLLSQVGGLSRKGDDVSFDAAAQQAQQAAVKAAKDAKATKDAALQAARQAIRNADFSAVNTLADLKLLLKQIVEVLKVSS